MAIKSVLLVDDSEAEQFLYKAILETVDPKIEVMSAYDGQEALGILETLDEVPDCMLVDINMPRMNGFEFLGEYSKKYDGNEMVIAMMTSSNHSDDQEKAQGYSFIKDFFPKPLTTEHVGKLSKYVQEK